MSRGAGISTGVFLALLLVFAGTRGDRVSEGIRTLALPTIDRADVTGIELRGGQAVRLLRDGAEREAWTLRDPASPERVLPADPAVVDRALAAIEALEADRFVTAKAENHADLAIDEQTGTVVTISRSGGDPVSLVLGRRSKSGGVLLRELASDEVFTGPAALAALQTPLAGWRRRSLMDFEPDGVERLTIRVPGAPAIGLVGTPNDAASRSWQLEDGSSSPEGFVLDAAAVVARVRAFAALRAIEFVDHDPGSGATGLDESAARVTAHPSDAAPVTVVLGAEGEPGRVHLRVEGDSQIYLVAKNAVTQLRASLEDLRDLRLFRFEPTAVRDMRIGRGSDVVALSRPDATDTWVLVELPDPLPDFELGPTAVSMQLRSLVGSRASSWYGPESEAPVDFAEGQPFRFVLADGSERSIDFAEADDGEVYARIGDGFAYVVPSAVHQRWQDPLPLFRRPPEPEMGGGIPGGMENLPPELRRQLEEAMRRQGAGGP